jgi:LPS sulfotransferase NodH
MPMSRAPIIFNRWRISAAARKIPAADFIDAQYDSPEDVRPTDVLVLLSTPRCGSTMICDLLRLNGGPVTHEYFAPFQNMPILARRWNCLKGTDFDEAAYVRALSRFRTSHTGWLGLNLQGSHLRFYTKMEAHFGAVRFHYVHLVRRDAIAQAVSFDIAMQTGQWSSEFAARSSAKYSFRRLLRRLHAIQNQNALIESFLLFRGASYQRLTYEDFQADREQGIRRFPCIPPEQDLVLAPTLRRQADDRSAIWKKRFTEDILADQSVYDLGLHSTVSVRHTLKIPRIRVT